MISYPVGDSLSTQGNETSLEDSGINMDDTRDAYRIILNLVSTLQLQQYV
jgi:hypothetical protein